MSHNFRMSTTARVVRLVQPLRRDERPSPDHFEVGEDSLAALEDGQVLVRAIYVSVSIGDVEWDRCFLL